MSSESSGGKQTTLYRKIKQTIMGNETSLPDGSAPNGETFQDEPTPFDPPTMIVDQQQKQQLQQQEDGGAATTAASGVGDGVDGDQHQQESQSLSSIPRIGRGGLVARLAASRQQQQQNSGDSSSTGDSSSANGYAASSSLYSNNSGLEPPAQPQQLSAAEQQYYQQQQQQQYASDVAGGNNTNNDNSHPLVGVMYTDGTSLKGSQAGGTIRKGLKQSGRGLINQMRSLSIKANTAGLKAPSLLKKTSSAQQQQQQQQKQPSGQETEWETRWDEDDDDESSEEDEDEVDEAEEVGKKELSLQSIPPAPPSTPAMSISSLSTPSSVGQLRPGMDGGHSSSFSMSSKQQQQQHPPGSTGPALVSPSTPSTVTPPEMVSKEDVALTKQADRVLQEGSNAVQWELANEAGKQDEVEYEKPNVQMFLPMLRVLGKGSFGKVVLVQKRIGKERGQLFAMKILRKAHLVKRRQIERTKTERKVLSVVDHPFIMKLHFAFQTDDKLYLVLDYCPGGELFFHLSRFRRFPERVARFYGAELLLAIGHLHKRGIIYRDLKPENVLLDAEGHVKLGDFGLAKDKIKHPCEGATSMCGTPEYMAPEVLGQAGHGFCVDYWGLGMLVYEMMTGLPPWYTTDRAKLFRRLKSAPLEIPSYFSAHAASYVGALLERNPRRRLGVTGIRDAMAHEFFRSISWRSLYSRRVEAPIRPCEGWKPPEPNGSGGDTSIDPFSAAQNVPSSRQATDGVQKMDSSYVDAAVANFDNTFTRMKVDTEDEERIARDHEEAEHLQELHDDTFIGFTFDDFDDEDARNNASSANNVQQRQRSTRQE